MSSLPHGPTAPVAVLRDIRTRLLSPRLKLFVDYMIAIQPAERLPRRDEFDPRSIPQLLDSIVLVKVEREGGRIRFRTTVVGQTVIEAAPAPIANRYLDDFSREVGGAEEILTTRRKVVDTGRALLNQSRPLVPFAYKMRAVEYVHCPLATDGRTVDQIVSCFFYVSGE